ncbi:UxaA family hydrolase [Halalkalibacter kiskunsagensis]|uniref:UxaA family hydrolase n=1 Tax=Halalkalibacter kiskunsagensis TaxID=1548599 RepID=UPI00300BACEE
MKEDGYYFMDSPGNDLESIAGQVAAGCNLIFFTTGNGSITNFPFVPTIKVVTTTERFELLSKDMDVNAGQYQDGLPMDKLGSQTFDLMLRIASGQKSVGEQAGHSQVQIWRDWQQTDDSQIKNLNNASVPNGIPLPIRTDVESENRDFSFSISNGGSRRQIGLILPTSLCAGQVANMITADLNEKRVGQPDHLSRFVALAHTEGCGNSGGNAEELYARTMVGYIHHPMVRHCLLLEHGCEKTHNAFMRNQIVKMGGDPDRLGFASIQLDGGIEQVSQKVKSWFADQIQMSSTPLTAQDKVGLEGLRIGIMTDGTPSKESAEQLATLTKCIVGSGGLVVVPDNSDLFATPSYRDAVLKQPTVNPSLAYGEHAKQVGFHMMETPTEHWVETMTGLGATGVEIILALVNDRPMQVHPFVPVLQMADKPVVQQTYASDLDLLLTGSPAVWNEQILERIKQVIEQSYSSQLYQQGNVDFQFTRGRFGVSL